MGRNKTTFGSVLRHARRGCHAFVTLFRWSDPLRSRGSIAFWRLQVDRFVNEKNIERYRRLREARDDAERREILKSLAEEQARFKLEFRSVDP